MKKKSKLKLTREGRIAWKAFQSAIKKVIREHKLKGIPLVVWRNGRVVKIPPSQLPAG